MSVIQLREWQVDPCLFLTTTTLSLEVEYSYLVDSGVEAGGVDRC